MQTATRQLYQLIMMVILVMVCSYHVFAAMPDSVRYEVCTVANTRVHVITVDLTDPTILLTPAVAYDVVGKRQSFIGFLADRQPLAQITGSYFSLQSGYPIGDLVIGSRQRFDGMVGSALAMKPDNTAEIKNIPYQWRYSWPGYESVVQGGIRLVQNGKYAVYPQQQGFRDPGLFRHATRTAVGLKNEKVMLLVGVNKEILLSQLAAIMKGLGCIDAMTFDGGTSTGLAYGSEVLITPGRTLANVLIVVKRPGYAVLPTLIPTLPQTAMVVETPLTPEPVVQSANAKTGMREQQSHSMSSLVNPSQIRYSNADHITDDAGGRWPWPILITTLPGGLRLIKRRKRTLVQSVTRSTAPN